MKTYHAFYFRIVREAVCRYGVDSHVEKTIALDLHQAHDKIRRRFPDAQIFALESPQQRKQQRKQHGTAAR